MRRLDSQEIMAIMLALTFLAPFAVMPWGFSMSESSFSYSFSISALLWRLVKRYDSENFELEGMDPEHPFDIIGVTIMMSLLSVVFAIQVPRYCTGKASGRITLSVGVLSLMQPFILSLSGILTLFDHGILIYIGPIPIQFVVGLILMKLIPPEIETEEDTGWWEAAETREDVMEDLHD